MKITELINSRVTEQDVPADMEHAVDAGEYDREGEMAKNQLFTIIDSATELHDMLHDDDNLPEWVQSKLTLAQDYMVTIKDYLKAKANAA